MVCDTRERTEVLTKDAIIGFSLMHIIGSQIPVLAARNVAAGVGRVTRIAFFDISDHNHGGMVGQHDKETSARHLIKRPNAISDANRSAESKVSHCSKKDEYFISILNA